MLQEDFCFASCGSLGKKSLASHGLLIRRSDYVGDSAPELAASSAS